jgi:cytoskeletal protein CcmA (bactofilin family)
VQPLLRTEPLSFLKGEIMLGKSKSDTPKTEEFKTEETPIRPTNKPVSESTRTLIGENISINGDIRGEGDLIIEGSVKGSVILEKYHLTVGSKGQVDAEINAGNVTVSGRLTGNITALDKVAITKDADFNGVIKAKRISIEDGAYLKAAIELERESQIKAVPIGKSTKEKPSGVQKESLHLPNEADQGK